MDFRRRALFLFVVALAACSFAVPSLTFAATTTFFQNFQLWDASPDILSLQQFLNAQGFIVAQSGGGSPGHETETFGNHTYQALVSFQASHDLPATGFFGPLTRAVINAFATSGEASSAGAAAVSTNTTTSTIAGTTTTATTSGQYIPGVTPLPGYAPGQIIFGGGGSAPDTTPPSVSLTAPSTGATVGGTSITLTATASDNVAVASVQFQVDGTNIGSPVAASPYTIAWDSTGVADGSHTLIAVARDTGGNYATSSAITVTVDNLVPISAGSADLYWVGGSGNWSDAHHWAITSGGTGQYDPPTAANVVHFVASSSVSSYTVTVDTAASSATTTVANPTSGSPTFAGSAAWTNSGGLTLVSGMGWTYTGAMTFNSTSLGKTITTAGVTLNNNITFNGTGGGWALQDNLTDGSADTLTLSGGTLNTNDNTVTAGFIVSTSGTRTLTLTNSTLNVSGTSGTPCNLSNGGTPTFTSTGSTVNFTGGAAGVALTATMSMGNFATVNFTGPGGAGLPGNWTFGLGSSTTFKTLSYLSSTNKTDTFSVSQVFTIQANGSLSLVGNSTVNRALVKSSAIGTARTITVPSTATVTITNVDFTDITAAGTFGTWSGTSIGDALHNTNITFTTAAPQTFAGGTKNWSDPTAWTSRVPLPQDNVTVSGAGALTADMPRLGANVDFTGFTGTASFPVANTIFGNLTLASSGTYVGNDSLLAITLAGRGSQTITTGGVQVPNNLTISAPGGTYALQDDLTLLSVGGSNSAGLLSVINGTLALGTHNATSWNFVGSGSATRAITGSGALTTLDNFAQNGVIFALTSTMDLSGFTGTVKYNGNVGGGTATRVGFNFAGLTIPNFEWTADGSTGTLFIQGANTFGTFKVDPSGTARTIELPSSTTQTITTLNLDGTSGNLLSVVSSTPGSMSTISVASGTVTTSYLSVKDQAATGGATFNTTNSVNVSNNSGWNFQ